MSSMFANAINMEANYIDSPNTSNVTNMRTMFSKCHKFNGEVNFDTQNVTDMGYVFDGCSEFNQEVNFDTRNVTTMNAMFRDSGVTTLDLSSFDTSNVISMNAMFIRCSATTGYAKTQEDADRFNASSGKPSALTFVVKP